MKDDWTSIHPSGPMALAETLESGQAFRWRKKSCDESEDHYEGVIFGNLVRVRQVGGDIHFNSAPDPESSIKPILEDYLGLNHDLESIYAEIKWDEQVGSAIDEYPGMRILRQDPWECLVAFICSANNNIPRISQNVEDIASAFGPPIHGADTHRRAFPGPDAIVEAGEDALRELRLGFRAKYIAASAERVANAHIDLFALREAPYNEALAEITTLAGVADKVGNCVLMMSMDKLEAFPVDVWIDRALREWYFSESESKSIPRTRMREWAQKRFGRYAGYANQYLFQSRRLQDKRQSS
ncbi:MAG: hypothetical protein F4X94_09500 [Dehalococcoidia bacterium]|nr:hypothetical protein [Dehalococcoidia bacterium]